MYNARKVGRCSNLIVMGEEYRNGLRYHNEHFSTGLPSRACVYEDMRSVALMCVIQ